MTNLTNRNFSRLQSGTRMSLSRTKSAAWTMVGVSILAATASAASAQLSPETPSTATVPVRDVTAPLAKATRPIGGANMLRALPDGSIFINDVQRRQLLRFDATLQNVLVVADTAAGALMPYGQRPIGLIPYLGDSSIVVDPATLSMVVLNKDGKTVRVMASPRTNDVNTLSNMNLGSHAFDQKGRLYYRQGSAGGAPGGGGMAMMFGSGNDRGGGDRGAGGGRGGQPGGQGATTQQGRGAAQPARPTAGDDPAFRGGGQGGGQPFGGPGGRGFNPASQPDSVPIVRVDFDTRKADTVAYVKVPKNETQMTRGEDGSTKISIKINPLPQADDWALLNDGTVAIMRVLDFHVDYYRPDGSHVSSDKLPFDWKRITDDDKAKLVDSLQTLAKAATERAGGGTGGGGFRMSFEPVAAEKLPDYYPPIRAGTTLADFDGNLWVLPATSNLSAQLATQFMGGAGGGMGGMGGRGGPPGAAGGAPGAPGAARAPGDSTRGAMPAAAMGMMAAMMNQPPLVYDIISPAGKMIERVKLPAGRQLLGFGPNGAIFLGARDGRQIIVEKVMRKE